MNIGIIGTGAYAIALSSILENINNLNITMWTKLEDEYNELKNNYTNLKVINYKLNRNIKFTMNLEELVNNNNIIILAIPTKYLKKTINEIKKYYCSQEILIATKGMIENPYCFINEYIKKVLNTNKISCISGPSFASDIIKKEPIGLTISSKNNNSLNYIINILNKINYITYDKTHDIIGVELCGILKNIFAIGSGILNGMNTNKSTIAKYLKDSSEEIKYIIKKFHGNNSTFSRYAGIGDFILTTTNDLSRNYTFGYLIGSNKDYINYMNNTTIEGLENLDGIYNLLKSKKINVKIINILYEIIYLKKDKKILLDYLKK